MKQPNAILKVAAVVSSVMLVGGLISYRAGALDSFVHSDLPVVEPESEPAPAPDAAATSTSVTDQTILLSTSKSAAMVIPVSPTQTDGPKQASPPPTFIGGSKSIAPLIPPKSASATPPSPTPAPPR